MNQTVKITLLIVLIAAIVGGLIAYLANSSKPSGTISDEVKQMKPGVRHKH